MSGIYIHIPFCKQACHYCNFHFSTSLKNKGTLVNAICKELQLRKEELKGIIQTIYLGGGTPSLLTSEELKQIFTTIFDNYKVSENAEITLEANPDDLSEKIIFELSNSPINRLSIGVQSFFEEDLTLMNRAHNAFEATECLDLAKEKFNNISVDLIYGIPGMTNERWQENLQKYFELDVPHLSCYALTVEPKTPLEHLIRKGVIAPVEDDVAKSHYDILISETEKAGYDNYEFSNFSMPGFHSKNNTAYWEGVEYLGIGPSAHSYNGKSRSWNINNNTKYIKKIDAGILPLEKEILSDTDRYNEYVMTRLRTKWGISLKEIEKRYGVEYRKHILHQAKQHRDKENLILEDDSLKISRKGKFLTDGIASDLFLVNLD